MKRGNILGKPHASKMKYFIAPVVILLTGFTMIVIGIIRGELQMILHKAVIVCLECIGIG